MLTQKKPPHTTELGRACIYWTWTAKDNANPSHIVQSKNSYDCKAQRVNSVLQLSSVCKELLYYWSKRPLWGSEEKFQGPTAEMLKGLFIWLQCLSLKVENFQGCPLSLTVVTVSSNDLWCDSFGSTLFQLSVHISALYSQASLNV